MTSPITIPKALAKRGDLVLIPKEEYEELMQLRKIKEFTPTPAQKRALLRARKNRAAGRVLSLHALERELGFTS